MYNINILKTTKNFKTILQTALPPQAALYSLLKDKKPSYLALCVKFCHNCGSQLVLFVREKKKFKSLRKFSEKPVLYIVALLKNCADNIRLKITLRYPYYNISRKFYIIDFSGETNIYFITMILDKHISDV